MLHFYTLREQRLSQEDQLTQDTLWIHVEHPDLAEINLLTKDYQLPRDYLTSILDDAENSRSEGLQQKQLEQAVLLLLQFPYETTSPSDFPQLHTYPLSVIITPNKQLITVTNYPLPFFKSLMDHSFTQKSLQDEIIVLLEILWQLTLSFNLYLKEIQAQLDQLEKQIKTSIQNKQLYQMMDIQKSLVFLDAATKANLKTLITLANTSLFKTDAVFKNQLHDTLVETRQAMTSANIHLKFANYMNDTFSAAVSNNLNIVMKFLTSLTLILTIPTIIAGIYGMNIKLPIAKNPYAFVIIIFFTVFICWIAFKILKKKDLI